jgi:hypothetical protein
MPSPLTFLGVSELQSNILSTTAELKLYFDHHDRLGDEASREYESQGLGKINIPSALFMGQRPLTSSFKLSTL